MNTMPGLWRSFSLVLILLTVLGCGSLGPVRPTQTPAPLGKGNGNTIGGSGGSSSSGSEDNPNPQNSLPVSSLQVTETPPATPTEPAEFSPGPYTVRQTMTLGKEKLGSVAVCIYRPWQVPVDTPAVSFEFVMGSYPLQAVRNRSAAFGYAYNIPSAGESHQAQGNYTLAGNKDGSIKVSITYRDHVVFKGFDGRVPGRYSFDLVPMGGTNTACQ